ncbi:MAG TPA: hypothetical protein V6C57_25745 [Coleofasciculaceae cyanobacterium]
MSQFRIRNVILPAVLVSSGVFSILTLPFVLNKAEPMGLSLPDLLEDSPQPIFDRDNRSTAIRYVGGAIVVSVGAGIATIEILRRLHPANRLSKPQKDSLNSQIRQLEAEGTSNPSQLSENVETTISGFLAEEKNAALEWSEAKALASERAAGGFNSQDSNPASLFRQLEPGQDFQLAPELQPIATHSIHLKGLGFQPDHLSDQQLRAALSNAQSELNTQNERDFQDELSNFDWAAPAPTASEQPTQPYETYRIRVPHRQHTLFGILLNGQYYSLVRTHKSREKILQIAENLRQRGEEVVITPIEERYAVWLLQPEAYSELVS